jgi:hypothetical protein
MDELTVTGNLSPSYRLEIDSSDKLKRILSKFKDKHLEITISIFRRKRSLSQNRWIWGVCVPTVRGWLKDTQGVSYDKDEVYYYIQGKALRRKIIIKEIAGEEVPVLEGKRMSQMTTKEFAEAVEDIVAYYAERGLVIELPRPGTNNVITEFIKDE